MKVYHVECPSCGGIIETEKDRKFLFCTYCGKKIYIDDEVKRIEITRNYNTHKTYTDEARIKESEVRNQIHQRNMEKEKKDDKVALLIFIFSIVFMIICFISISRDGMPKENEVKISVDAKSFRGDNYKQVIRELKDAGFENIDTEKLYDLINGWFVKDGQVDRVSIAGNAEFTKGDIFAKDAHIIVTYHTFKE